MAEERHCPTCGDTNLTLTPDTPIDGWNELACKSCRRVLEIGRPGVGPLVDPLWVNRRAPDIVERMKNYIDGEHDDYVPEVLQLACAEIERLADRIEVLEAALHKIDDITIDHTAMGIARKALAHTALASEPNK